MTDRPDSLEARVSRLERLVEDLLGTQGGTEPVAPDQPPVPGRTTAPSPGGAPADGPEGPPRAEPGERPRADPGGGPRATPGAGRAAAGSARTTDDWLALGEDWLGRVGVALLLLGLAFLYRYAVERGWITPWLRVTFGLGVGSILLLLGLYKAPTRRLYGQVLLGGAVAVLYLTGWAAHVLYGLVPWIVGFSFMMTVTVLALALAERREHQSLAVIGVAGGLGTPFLLDTGTPAVVALVVYAALVLGWAGVLQLRRGWGVLLALNVVGGMLVMGLGAVGTDGPGVEAAVAQWGIVMAWCVGCAFPFLLGWLHARDPGGWPPLPSIRSRPAGEVGSVLLRVLGLCVTAVAVLLSALAWELERTGFGVGLLVAAAVAFQGHRLVRPHGHLVRPALEASAVFLLLGTALAVDGDGRPLLVALEAALLLWASTRQEHARTLAPIGHGAFVLLALGFLVSLQVAAAMGRGPTALLGASTLGAIAAAALAGSRFPPDLPVRRAYAGGSYVAFLAWQAWVLTPLSGGHGLTSTAWGLTALVVLIRGVRAGSPGLRLAGLATLAAVAAKLLLIDLAALDRGLRILLFLGFGVFFLALGWVLKGRDAGDARVRPDIPPEGAAAAEPGGTIP